MVNTIAPTDDRIMMAQQNNVKPKQATGSANPPTQAMAAPAKERSEAPSAERKETLQSPATERREKTQNTNPVEALKAMAVNEGNQSASSVPQASAQMGVNQVRGLQAYSAKGGQEAIGSSKLSF